MKYRKQINVIYYFSSVIIFLLSALSHFMYDWTNNNEFISMFVPTNESIFQHLKMIFFPIVLYYLVTYIIYNRKYDIIFYKWILSAITTFLFTSGLITASYYIFRTGFNIESMFIDIVSLISGLILSSFLCAHLYYRTKIMNVKVCNPIVILGLLALVISISFFDKNPMKVDMFYDNENDTYYSVEK